MSLCQEMKKCRVSSLLQIICIVVLCYLWPPVRGVGQAVGGVGQAVSVVDHPDSAETQHDDEAVVENEDAEPRNRDSFYATREWQTVEPGQVVPKGLHIRLNLETGLREAKLLDESSDNSGNKDGRQGMVKSKTKTFNRDELKEALKNFKTDPFTDAASLEQMESVKKRFRSYETLQKELKKMNAAIKTDAEIVTELVAALKVNGSLMGEELENLLRSLEYYVHQFDNAVLFADLGGMALLSQYLNSTHIPIRREAASVLSAAVQSNPKVQVKALEQGLLSQLVRRLATDQSQDLYKIYLFAVSSLVRHFPYAQLQFLRLGGLALLSSVFSTGESEVLRVKTVTLLHDMLLEKDEAMSEATSSTDQTNKQQYSQLPLVESLTEFGWCDRIPTLLSPSMHDTNEKTLLAMRDLTRHCSHNFRAFVPSLRKLRREYEQLAQQETTDDPAGSYFSSFVTHIDEILRNVPVNDEL